MQESKVEGTGWEENLPNYLNKLEKIKNKKGFWSNILKSIFMALVLCQGKTWVGRTLMLDFR